MGKHQRGVLKGSKINKRHSTFLQGCAPIIVAAKELPEVSKVVLGKIAFLGGGRRELKLIRIQAGLKASIRTGGGVQKLFIYTEVPEVVQEKLEKVWAEI